jgi:hypothetical protein
MKPERPDAPALELSPVQLDRESSGFLEVAHILVGEPASTSPGYALGGVNAGA